MAETVVVYALAAAAAAWVGWAVLLPAGVKRGLKTRCGGKAGGGCGRCGD